MVAGAGDAWDLQVLRSFPHCGGSTSRHPWLGTLYIGEEELATVALLSMTTRQFPDRPTILVTSGNVMESDGISAESLAAKVGCPSSLQPPSPGSSGRGATRRHWTESSPTRAECDQASRVCPNPLYQGAMWSCKVPNMPRSFTQLMQVQQRQGCGCDPCGSDGPLGRGGHGAHLSNLPPRGRQGFRTGH